MDPFALRPLGRSGVSLPALGMGGASLGNLFLDIPDVQAADTLDAAWEAGIRFYDTSPWYGHGLSEMRFGRGLYRRPREEVILSTKVGRVFKAPADPAAFARSPRKWPRGLHFVPHHDYTYDGIMRSYEDSLMRLGMNRIDVLVIHDLDIENLGTKALVDAHLVQLATSGWRALAELKAAGLVKAVGAGVNGLGTIPRFVELMPLDFFLVAIPYTLAQQPALDAEFPLCERHGIGVVIGTVYASGILATGPVPGAKFNYRDPAEAEVARIRRMQEVCASFDVPLAAAALQFPLHHPIVASVIPGAFAPEHVRQTVETMRHPVPDALWAALKREGLLREDAPTP
ncbi:aldo/keto reductase [Alsobacter sp. R-9]